MSTPRKYIDSHWLVFVFQGIIALLFGWYVIFTGISDTTTLVAAVSIVMLLLGIIELLNLLRRTRLKETWGLSLAIAVMEIVIAVALLVTLNQHVIWHLAIIATYVVIRGVLEIVLGLRAVDDSTDKAIWVLCGMCGAVLGFVILNTGHLNPTAFLQTFGVYMIGFGFCSMIYGLHNHDQKNTYLAEQRAAKRKQVLERRTEKAGKRYAKATAKRYAAKKSAKRSKSRK